MFLVYGKPGCSYCVAAKELLAKKGLEFEYLTLGEEYTKEQLVEACAPHIPKTLPQVFLINRDSRQHIGGYSELAIFVG